MLNKKSNDVYIMGILYTIWKSMKIVFIVVGITASVMGVVIITLWLITNHNPEAKIQSGTPMEVYNVQGYHVEALFVFEGKTIYRFKDSEGWHYFDADTTEIDPPIGHDGN